MNDIDNYIAIKDKKIMQEYIYRLNMGFKRNGLPFHIFLTDHPVERIIMRGISILNITRAIDYALTKSPELVEVGKEIRISLAGLVIVLKVNVYDKTRGNYIIGLITVFVDTSYKTYCKWISVQDLVEFKNSWNLDPKYCDFASDSLHSKHSRSLELSTKYYY